MSPEITRINKEKQNKNVMKGEYFAVIYCGGYQASEDLTTHLSRGKHEKVLEECVKKA